MTDEKQDDLKKRLDEARKERQLPPREGHEISAAGKEVRTPSEGEFFTSLEKALTPEAAADELAHPTHGQNGG